MDSTLVSVTILSMGMATALSVIVWRLLREDRQRSEARVAALGEMAAVSSAPATAAPPADDDLPLARETVDRPLRAHQPVAPSAAASGSAKQAAVRAARLRRATPTPQAVPIASSTPLFAEPARSSPWGSRFAVMAGLTLLITSGVFFALASSYPANAPGRTGGTPGGAAPPAASGLELLSLRDAREGGSLTISGLVENPRGGVPLSRTAVTVYTFDETGAFLASGRALLDVTALQPGDDSPFVVTVPVSDAVARYRIGFRSEDGRVIAHVDRRQQNGIAASGGLP